MIGQYPPDKINPEYTENIVNYRFQFPYKFCHPVFENYVPCLKLSSLLASDKLPHKRFDGPELAEF